MRKRGGVVWYGRKEMANHIDEFQGGGGRGGAVRSHKSETDEDLMAEY